MMKINIFKAISRNITTVKRKSKVGEEVDKQPKDILKKSAYRNLKELFDKDEEFVYRGRKPYFDMMFGIFAKLDKKNLIIIGSKGTGKEGLVYGLAERIKKGTCPDMFKDYDVIAIDLRELFKELDDQVAVIEQLNKVRDNLKTLKKAIVFVKPFDCVFEFSMLGEIGKWIDDLGHTVVGILDNDEFDKYYKPNYKHPVVEQFDILKTEYPTLDETYEILKTKISIYEARYGIKLKEEDFEKLLMTVFQENDGCINLDIVLDYVDCALANARLHGIKEVDYRSIMEIQKASLVQMQEDFSPEELEDTSMHEASHAVVAITLNEPPRFVSIIPEYEEFGYNYFDKGKYVYTRKDLIRKIAIALASCVLSKISDTEFTNGCSGDLKSATIYAYNMILCWGMSEVEGENDVKSFISYLKNGDFDVVFLSDAAKDEVKEKVGEILREASILAEKCLTDHLDAVYEISKALLRCCSLSRTDLLKLYNGEIVAEDLQDVKWREIE
jgi:hypothetical protein